MKYKNKKAQKFKKYIGMPCIVTEEDFHQFGIISEIDDEYKIYPIVVIIDGEENVFDPEDIKLFSKKVYNSSLMKLVLYGPS